MSNIITITVNYSNSTNKQFTMQQHLMSLLTGSNRKVRWKFRICMKAWRIWGKCWRACFRNLGVCCLKFVNKLQKLGSDRTNLPNKCMIRISLSKDWSRNVCKLKNIWIKLLSCMRKLGMIICSLMIVSVSNSKNMRVNPGK